MPNNHLKKAFERLNAELINGAVLAAQDRLRSEPVHKEGYVLAKLARESALRGAIDESCGEWLDGNPWPMMSEDDATFLYDRLFYSAGFARFLDQAGFVSEKNEKDLLRWFLVDAWAQISCLNWRYGLENPS